MLPILTSKNRLMNTFIIVNITLTCNRQFMGLVYVFLFQKGFTYPFSFARNRIYLGTHLKKELNNVLKDTTVFPIYSHTVRVDRNLYILLMVNINPICKHSHKKLARGYCLCYWKTFSLVPDSTECAKIFVIEKCSALFEASPKIK